MLVCYQLWCEDAAQFGLDPSELVGLIAAEDG